MVEKIINAIKGSDASVEAKIADSHYGEYSVKYLELENFYKLNHKENIVGLTSDGQCLLHDTDYLIQLEALEDNHLKNILDLLI